jgi:hypothetical protein
LICVKNLNNAPRIVPAPERHLAQAENTHVHREAGMLKLKSLGIVIALAMPLGFADMAAAKHLTYEEAWAHCKKFVDVLPRDAQSQRYSRGSSCMHKYGYKL